MQTLTYVGPSDIRIVTAAQLTALGISDQATDLVFNRANNYTQSVPDDVALILLMQAGFVAGSGASASSYMQGLSHPTGLWQPSDWGATGGWRTKRAAAHTSLVTVGSFMASIGQGFYCSDFPTKSYFGGLMTALQALYGDGGSGWISLVNTIGVTAGSAGTVTASGAGGNGAGGWDKLAAGLNSYALFPHVAGSGVTLTAVRVRGTTVAFQWYPNTALNPSDFTYSIDGGAAVTVHTFGAGTQTGTLLVTGLAPGNHTVVITATAGQPIIHAVGGFNATGIVGHNFGFAGRTSGDINAASSLTNAGWTTTGAVTCQQIPSDLFIYGADVFINDIAAASTALTVASNVARAFDYVKAGNPQCDIVMVVPPRGNTVDGGPLYPSYIREGQAVCEAYGAMLVNLWPMGKNSFSYWNGLGYWGDGTNDGLAGSNAVHWSDAGHAFAKTVLGSLLTT